jgi:hypothetical protein
MQSPRAGSRQSNTCLIDSTGLAKGPCSCAAARERRRATALAHGPWPLSAVRKFRGWSTAILSRVWQAVSCCGFTATPRTPTEAPGHAGSELQCVQSQTRPGSVAWQVLREVLTSYGYYRDRVRTGALGRRRQCWFRSRRRIGAADVGPSTGCGAGALSCRWLAGVGGSDAKR